MHHENGNPGAPQHAFRGAAEDPLAQAAVAIGTHDEAVGPCPRRLVEQALGDAFAARRVAPGLGAHAMASEVAGERPWPRGGLAPAPGGSSERARGGKRGVTRGRIGWGAEY